MSAEVRFRTCIACRKKRNSSELLHLCYNKGYPLLNSKSKNGRGVYLCYDEKCIEKCFKKNLLNQGFKASTDERTKRELQKACIESLGEQTEE